MKFNKIIMSTIVSGLLIGCGSSSSSSDNKPCIGAECKKEDTNRYSVLRTKSLFTSTYQNSVDKKADEGWKDAKDSYIVSLSANSNNIVIGSIFHNSLNILNLDSKKIKYNPFAVLKDSGNGSLDSISGASENKLEKQVVTKDNFIFTNIVKKSSKGDSKYGFYKAKINEDSSVKYDEAKRVAENILLFDISEDEKKLITYTKEKDLVLFDKELNELSSLESKTISSIVMMNNDTFYITLEEDKKNYIQKVNISNNSISFTEEKIQIPFKAKMAKRVKGKVIFTNYSYSNPITNVAIYDGKKLDTFNLQLKARSLAISPDGKLLAGINWDAEDIPIYNLKEKELQHLIAIKKGASAGAIAFIDNNTLIYPMERNAVDIIKIEDTKNPIVIKEILKKKIEILEKSINDGANLDVIVKDLNLSFKDNDITYEYSTNLENIDIKTGKIKRSSEDKAGNFKIKAIKKEEHYEKTYDVIVRKSPNQIPITTFDKMIDTQDIFGNLSINKNGDLILVTSLNFFTKNQESIHIFKFNNNTIKEIGLKSGFKFNKNERILEAVFKDDNILSISKKDNNNNGKNIIRISKLKNDYSIDKNSIKEVEISDGTPLNVALNKQNTTLRILIKKDDKSFAINEYSISNSSDIQKINSISIEDKEFNYSNSAPAPTMLIDGDNTYLTSHKNGVILRNKDKFKEIPIDDAHAIRLYKDRIYISSGNGYIYSFDKNLEDKKTYNTGISMAEIYGFDFINKNSKDYIIVNISILDPKSASLAGVSMLEIQTDNSLVEKDFYPVTGQYYLQKKGLIVPVKTLINKDGVMFIHCVTPQYTSKLFFIN